MRIGTSPFGVDLSAQNSLMRAIDQLTRNSIRLSTMKRVNSGADDPSGVIGIGALESELAALEAASRNASRAVGIVRTADTGLDNASELLRDIKANLVEAAGGGLSEAQLEAKQIEINAALEALDRIGTSTSYAGRKLLDGSAGYQVSGVNAAQVTDVQVYLSSGGSQTPDIEVVSAAEAASVTFSSPTGTVGENVKIEIQGNEGTVVLQFDAATTLDQAAEAINSQSTTTGVTASVSGTDLVISSTSVGSAAMVSVRALEGSFDVGPSTVAHGADVIATVDGVEMTGQGNKLSVKTATLEADIEFAQGFTGSVDSMTISGNALTFVFSPNVGDRSTLALPNVSAAALGGSAGRLSDLASGGSADVASGNFEKAMAIVESAESKVLGARARAGAFEKYTIDSSANLLDSMEEATSEGLSFLRDTNVAEATSNLIRSQILVQSSLSMISMIGRQRSAIGSLLG